MKKDFPLDHGYLDSICSHLSDRDPHVCVVVDGERNGVEVLGMDPARMVELRLSR